VIPTLRIFVHSAGFNIVLQAPNSITVSDGRTRTKERSFSVDQLPNGVDIHFEKRREIFIQAIKVVTKPKSTTSDGPTDPPWTKKTRVVCQVITKS
jgi:hypothetical protein